MPLNCKPGDLAVIVRATNPVNIGKVARVIKAVEPGTCIGLDSKGIPCHLHTDHPWWEIDTSLDLISSSGGDHRRTLRPGHVPAPAPRQRRARRDAELGGRTPRQRAQHARCAAPRAHRRRFAVSAPPVKQQVLTCAAKRRYADEWAARAAGCAHLGSGRSEQVILYCYLCAECGGWHLTKSVQRGAAAITAEDPYILLKE